MRFKPFALTALAVLTSVALATPAWSDETSEFQTLYAKFRDAMDARNGVAIRELLAKDFQAVDIQGNISDAAAMLADLRRTPANPSRQRHTTVDSVQVAGSSALVVQSYNSSFRLKAPGGATHQMRVSSRSNDTWVRSGDHWLLQATETRAMIVEEDGMQITNIDLDNKSGQSHGYPE